MRCLGIAACLLLCAGAPALAESVQEAAAVACARHAAGDEAGLTRLAWRDEPDPWDVVDALLARGARPVALAFARAAPRADTRGLPAYAAECPEGPPQAAWRARLVRAQAPTARGAWNEVLTIVGAAPKEAAHVCAWRLRLLRAAARARLGEELQAAGELEALAAEAQAAGWLALAARALSRAGLCHVRAERWTPAAATLERLIVLEQQRANDAGVAEAYLRLGFAYESRGDGTLAIESVARSRDVAGRIGAEAAEARAWSSLARLYLVHAEDPRRALEALGRAVERFEKADDPAGLSHALIELGLVRQRSGDLGGAAEAHKRAYEVLRTLRDRPGMAVALSGLGGMCIRRGEYARALACLEEARTLMRTLGNRRGEAVVLSQLGELYSALSDAPAARQCFADSFALAAETGDAATMARSAARADTTPTEATDGGEAPQLLERALGCLPDGCDREACASILRRLGSLHLVRGELGRALQRHEGALAEAEATQDPLQIVASLVELATLRRAMGTLDGALELDQRAVQLAERSASHEALARALWSRASTHLRRHEAAESVRDARRAVREAALVCTRLPEFEGSRASDLWRGLYEVGVEAAARLGSVADAAWFLEAGRAGMLLTALGGRDALASHVVSAPRRAEEARARASEAAAWAAHRRAWRSGSLPAMREAERSLHAARGEVARIVLQIRREARGAARLLCPEPDDLATLQRRLGPQEALVLYALLPRRVHALVLTPTQARLVDLGLRAPLERAVEQVDLQVPAARAEAGYARLRALLVRPLRLPPAARRLLVSPMGCLGLLAPALLFPDRAVAYVPSGTTLGLLQESRALRGDGVLAVGDPDYAGRQGDGRFARPPCSRWPPLPATRGEAQAVGDVVLLGGDATVTNLRAAVASRPRWRALHVACHGRVHAAAPMAAALVLSPEPGDDGLLTALDLLGMPVRADLAVLSACDTARGGVYDVEGVVGLARAFMIAGAPRVVCSLWQVDDEATRALMIRFHTLWRGVGTPGCGAAEALAEAQAFVRSDPRWRHPRYWAAWVLWGLAQ